MIQSSLSTVKYLVYLVIVLLCFSFSPVALSSAESAPPLKAGTAKIDITPELPVQMSGYAVRKGLSEGIESRLYARTIAFESGGERLVIVSTDLIGFYGTTFDYFSDRILREFSLERDELLLCATHHHSGPSVTLSNSHPNNITYTKSLEPKLLKVIREAMDSMKPVKIGAGVGYSPVGINRRAERKDGSVTIGLKGKMN